MIKKGDKFKCIKDVIMDSGVCAYSKESIYYSDLDDCITDNQKVINHLWSNNYIEYFIKYNKDTNENVDSHKKGKCENIDLNEKNDRVNHPSHYTWLKDLCGIEVIDITRHMNFNLGNVIKYTLRAGHKSEEGLSDKQKHIEDLKKALFYIKDEIKRLEEKEKKDGK